MASLQDQLLKAGLANKQSAKQARSEKRKKNKAIRKNQAQADTSLQDKINAEKEQRAQQDLAKNQAIKAELDKKSELGKVKQMIEQLHIKEYEGELEYNYVYQNKVKKLLLNEINHNALVKGRLSICALEDVVYLMPSVAAEKIAKVDESYILLMNDNEPVAAEEDDPYAEFQIPDDLMW